jgi:hypothetical protein
VACEDAVEYEGEAFNVVADDTGNRGVRERGGTIRSLSAAPG